MITPRTTQLVRVANLHAFRHAIRTLAGTENQEPRTENPEPRTPNPEPRTPNPVVVVPTRGAARLLGHGVTRDELYDHLQARLANPPRRLSALERDVMAQAAARAASARSPGLAFQLRPGLVAEMLRFYDQLRRQSQQVKRFQELIDEALGSDDLDRAAERMRVQTRFLADAFGEYERLAAASRACDEHTLRDRVIAEPAADPVRHIIVTIPDWIADAEGFYVADFDLLARIPGLERLDIVCTERVLATGFHERLHGWLPGLDETRFDATGGAKPVLVTPPPTLQSPIPNPQALWWTLRDREEELVLVARRLKADARNGEAVPLDRTAMVFKHPLPYLYMAPDVFGSAGIRFQTADGLPLAAEPTAAALDLVLDTVSANFTRTTLVALLRSPHLVFTDEGAEVARESTSALDRFLSDARFLGELERLEALGRPEGLRYELGRPKGLRYESVEHEVRVAQPFRAALLAAVAAARELAPLATARPASQQLAQLLAFWSAHLRPMNDDDPHAQRERRARAAIADTMTALAASHAALDDPEWTIDDVALAVRRSIEQQTFAPHRSQEQTLEQSAVAGRDQSAVAGCDQSAVAGRDQSAVARREQSDCSGACSTDGRAFG